VAFVVIIGLVFGAADQFLGSLHAAQAMGWWTISVSGLSAPWLLVPFVAGRVQPAPRRAIVAGLLVTLSALAGYFAMTLSPLEGVHFHAAEAWGLIASNRLIEVGGLVGGPVFGWLGYRWRVCRSWVAAGAVACALCLEPVAVAAARRSAGRSDLVWCVEVLAGLVTATYFFVVKRRSAAVTTI
jgi:bacteriorhodopsin